MSKTRKSLKSISLFSGAFGLDLGLEAAGFVTLAAIEKDKLASVTIQNNILSGRTSAKRTIVKNSDVGEVCPSALMKDLKLKSGELDLITGGPPCQAFSTSGRRQSVSDPRGTLLWSIIDYVEVFQPKAFLIENVRGLLSAALKHRPIALRPDKGGLPLSADELPGSVIRKFLCDVNKRLNGAYRLDIFEVNSVNYGASQIRERAIIIGNRLGKIVEFPEPTYGHDGIPFRTLGDVISRIDNSNSAIMDFSDRKKVF